MIDLPSHPPFHKKCPHIFSPFPSSFSLSPRFCVFEKTSSDPWLSRKLFLSGSIFPSPLLGLNLFPFTQPFPLSHWPSSPWDDTGPLPWSNSFFNISYASPLGLPPLVLRDRLLCRADSSWNPITRCLPPFPLTSFPPPSICSQPTFHLPPCWPRACPLSKVPVPLCYSPLFPPSRGRLRFFFFSKPFITFLFRGPPNFAFFSFFFF